MPLSKIQVDTKNQKYSVIIGNNVFTKLTKSLKKNLTSFQQYLVIIDKKVPAKEVKKILIVLNKKKNF